MSKLEGPENRCCLCSFRSKFSGNLFRHMAPCHVPKESAERRRLSVAGEIKCAGHKTAMTFFKRYHQERLLNFVVRSGEEQMLGLHGYQSQLIETPSCEWKGTTSEDSWVRNDIEG